MEPATVIAMGALVAPRTMVPVLKRPPSSVAVWISVSEFRQATVWPTFTVAAAGENDMPPMFPTTVITRSAVAVDGGVGVGVGFAVGVVAGADGEPPPPQLESSTSRSTAACRGGIRGTRIGPLAERPK